MTVPEPIVTKPVKPLGRKAYGSIPHLPTSRMGPADHHCTVGEMRIATEKVRSRRDVVVVQEKLDGSCCAVARIGDDIVALQRKGYLARSSPFEQHHLFADWVDANRDRFAAMLGDGERAVGEWLALAHGTRYDLPHEPFVLFDLMVDTSRFPHEVTSDLAHDNGFTTPRVLAIGPTPLDTVKDLLKTSGHGALDPVEGAVWRVERDSQVDFLVKWVRPDKVDGCYLPELTGGEPVWNWQPRTPTDVSGSSRTGADT